MLVIDTSAIVGVALQDEPSDFAERVLEEVGGGGGAVPSIFWYELRNVMVVNERRGRIAPNGTLEFLQAVAELPIQFVSIAGDQPILDLARRLNLSVYDAAYLEVALRAQAPLATLDRRLREAALAAGARVFS